MSKALRILSWLLVVPVCTSGAGCLEEPLSNKTACRGAHDCEPSQACVRSTCTVRTDDLGDEDPGDNGEDQPDVFEKFEIVSPQTPTGAPGDVLFDILVNRLEPPISTARAEVFMRSPGESLMAMNLSLVEDTNDDNLIGSGDRLRVTEPPVDWVNADAIGEELRVELRVIDDNDTTEIIGTLYWLVGEEK